MDSNYFRDKLFDVVNESELELSDLEADERGKRLIVTVEDGTAFEISVNRIET